MKRGEKKGQNWIKASNNFLKSMEIYIKAYIKYLKAYIQTHNYISHQKISPLRHIYNNKTLMTFVNDHSGSVASLLCTGMQWISIVRGCIVTKIQNSLELH